MTGSTSSTNFPTESALQPTTGGYGDAFVSKLNAAGRELVYSTYLGGGSDELGEAIAVDSSGAAYLTGVPALDVRRSIPRTASAVAAASASGTNHFRCARGIPEAYEGA